MHQFKTSELALILLTSTNMIFFPIQDNKFVASTDKKPLSWQLALILNSAYT